MVKNFIELNDKEKLQVYKFLNRNEKIKKTDSQLQKEIMSPIYNNGEGSLFCFDDLEVIGKAFVVLEVVDKLKVIYIHSVEILDDIKEKNSALEKLVSHSKRILDKYNGEKIFLGIRGDNLLQIVEELYGNEMYGAYKMVLANNSKLADTLELLPLKEDILEEFVTVYNKSFMDMPHGTFIDLNEAREQLESSNDNNFYFFVCDKKIKVGFLEVRIEGNIGEFDIGLCKEYRGKGYGKRLLDTAIDFLQNRNIGKITLTVIEKNKIAFNMYKKRGFIIEEKISDWIEILI